MATTSGSDPAAVLTALRQVRGWSDQDVADACGMHYKAIYNRRKGIAAFSHEDLTTIAAAFGVPVTVWWMTPTEAAHIALETMSDKDFHPSSWDTCGYEIGFLVG